MSFPSSPANGQQATINGIVYSYSTSTNAWVRVVTPLTGTTSSFTVSNTASSTSTNTGALVVAGGAGIGGALYVNTAGYISGAQIITTATVAQYISGGTSTSSCLLYTSPSPRD